jgi:hypothetical protein
MKWSLRGEAPAQNCESIYCLAVEGLCCSIIFFLFQICIRYRVSNIWNHRYKCVYSGSASVINKFMDCTQRQAQDDQDDQDPNFEPRQTDYLKLRLRHLFPPIFPTKGSSLSDNSIVLHSLVSDAWNHHQQHHEKLIIL